MQGFIVLFLLILECEKYIKTIIAHLLKSILIYDRQSWIGLKVQISKNFTILYCLNSLIYILCLSYWLILIKCTHLNFQTLLYLPVYYVFFNVFFKQYLSVFRKGSLKLSLSWPMSSDSVCWGVAILIL